jgi:hypothetical protein
VSKRLIGPLLGALVIALTVVGCGSGEGAATTSITKAEFIEKANAVCVKTHEQVETKFAAYAKGLAGKEPTTPTAVAATQAEVVETILNPAKEQEVDELRSLGAPSGDEAQVEAIVDSLAEGVGKAEKHPGPALENGDEAFGKAERLAREYGLASC